MESGPAFPAPVFILPKSSLGDQDAINFAKAIRNANPGGITVRDYFAAHAPETPAPWFLPAMTTKRPKPRLAAMGGKTVTANEYELDAWDHEHISERYKQWPYAWADMMLAEREK